MTINPACGLVPHAEIVSHELNKNKYMKKMYQNPETQVTEMMPQSIICASVGQGDPVPDPGSGGDPMFGD